MLAVIYRDVRALLLQKPGGGQPRHPGSDDRDLLHGVALPAQDCRRSHLAQVVAQGRSSRRASAMLDSHRTHSP